MLGGEHNITHVEQDYMYTNYEYIMFRNRAYLHVSISVRHGLLVAFLYSSSRLKSIVPKWTLPFPRDMSRS